MLGTVCHQCVLAQRITVKFLQIISSVSHPSAESVRLRQVWLCCKLICHHQGSLLSVPVVPKHWVGTQRWVGGKGILFGSPKNNLSVLKDNIHLFNVNWFIVLLAMGWFWPKLGNYWGCFSCFEAAVFWEMERNKLVSIMQDMLRQQILFLYVQWLSR